MRGSSFFPDTDRPDVSLKMETREERDPTPQFRPLGDRPHRQCGVRYAAAVEPSTSTWGRPSTSNNATMFKYKTFGGNKPFLLLDREKLVSRVPSLSERQSMETREGERHFTSLIERPHPKLP